MNEETLVKTLALPHGQEWAWFADANLVALAPHLNPAEREEALSQVQAHWRRACLRIVPDGSSSALSTQPMPTQTIRNVVEAL